MPTWNASRSTSVFAGHNLKIMALLSLALGTVVFFGQVVPARKTQSPSSKASASERGIWTSIFPVSEQIFTLIGDKRDPKILFAGTHRGLYKSSNGGMTWSLVFRFDATGMTLAQSGSAPSIFYLGFSGGGGIGGMAKSADHGDSWQALGAADIKRPVHSVEVDAQNAEIVYVLSDKLYKSLNGGRTWGDISDEYSPGRFVVLDPNTSGHLITDVSNSADGGTTWRRNGSVMISVFPFGPKQNRFDVHDVWSGLSFDPTDRSVIAGLVQANGWPPPNLVISRDGGASWTDISVPENPNSQTKRADTRAWTWSLKSPGMIYAGSSSSLYSSPDYGQTWNQILPSGTSDVVAPDSGEIYAVTEFGVVKSRNGGRNWHLAAVGLPIRADDPDSFRSGYKANAPLLHAINGGKVYVGGRGGFWVTIDGGLSWNWYHVDGKLPNTVSADIIPRFDGENVRQLLAENDGSLVLNMASGAGQIVGSEILRVTPDGKLATLKIARNPNMVAASPADSNVIYMTASNGLGSALSPENGTVLMKSDDAGFSWRTYDLRSLLRATVASWQIVSIPAMAISPQTSQTAYVAIRFQEPPPGLLAPTEMALAMTSDGGATWRDVFPTQLMPRPRFGPGGDLSQAKIGLTVDPKNPRVVYLFVGEGVFKSTDGGTRWTPLVAQIGKVADIAVDTTNSQILYIASASGISISRDGGTTWATLSQGLSQDTMHRVAVDGPLVLAQGFNGIYRLSFDGTSWVNSRWDELEEKPELDQFKFDPRCVNCGEATPVPVGASAKTTESGSTAATGSDSSPKKPSALIGSPTTPAGRMNSKVGCSDNDACVKLGESFLAAGRFNEFRLAWNRALSLGPLKIALCRERTMQPCERGTIQLSKDEISFHTEGGIVVFAAPPAEVEVRTMINSTAHVALGLRVSGKNYELDFIPIGVSCQVSILVQCPSAGAAQQSAVLNLLSGAIQDLGRR